MALQAAESAPCRQSSPQTRKWTASPPIAYTSMGRSEKYLWSANVAGLLLACLLANFGSNTGCPRHRPPCLRPCALDRLLRSQRRISVVGDGQAASLRPLLGFMSTPGALGCFMGRRGAGLGLLSVPRTLAVLAAASVSPADLPPAICRSSASRFPPRIAPPPPIVPDRSNR
ncbi:uncharacterized protein IWZ02DRAFT_195617 [Phyllosticta citriasiana]|uniref:uncharacterized protein n=1 Tax=Phyllosticta citriasiana TaxID=595635 RepID=UPI0030FD6514